MTVYNWSALTNNQQIAFNPATDKLTFDSLAISAGSVDVRWTDTTSILFGYAGKNVTLAADIRTITSSNVSFANGSLLIVGDNSTGVTGDNGDNLINGSSNEDQFIGLGGNDTINGGAGSDRYLVREDWKGNVVITDTGGTNDTVVFYHNTEWNSATNTMPYRTDMSRDASGANIIATTYKNELLDHTIVMINQFNSDSVIGIETLTTRGEYPGGYVSSFDNTLTGSLTGTVNADLIVGKVVGELINGAAGDDDIQGGDGNDTIYGGDGSDGISGGNGNDIIYSGAGNDDCFGGSGDDTIYTTSDPTLTWTWEEAWGDAGNDRLVGGDGNDGLSGGDGNDTLEGGAGTDGLNGGAGDDVLIGGTGNDTINGSDGIDTAQFSSTRSASTVVKNADGSYTISSTADGSDTLTNIEYAQFADQSLTLTIGNSYNWSTLANNQQIAFNPSTDKLTFDSSTISAASVRVSWSWTPTVSSTFTSGDKTVVLQVDIKALTSSNIVFLNSSLFLNGDNTTFTTADDLSNILTGSAGNDYINGFGGIDSLYGGAGDDSFKGANAGLVAQGVIDGGTGTDTVNFFTSATPVSGINANLVNHTVSQSGNSVSIFSVERIFGTVKNDTFVGGDPSHALDSTGSYITEIFRGYDGNDTITGGANGSFNTVADYSSNASNQVVITNLRSGFVIDGLGGIDTLTNVRQVWGGSAADQLIGGSLNRSSNGMFLEIFRGNAGNDAINGNNAYSDGSLRASFDRADYSNNTSSQAISVNLATGVASDGLGGTDTLIDINQVYGGAGADVITGSSANEHFDGGAGNDTIDGGGGVDAVRYLQSSAGVIVNLGLSSITINPSVNAVTGLTATQIIAAGTANDGMSGTDTLISIRHIEGSNYNDFLRGTDSIGLRSYLSGFAGNNTLEGGLGIGIADYQYTPLSFGGITASLASNTIQNKEGGIDALINIKGLGGTNSNDSLTGGSGDEQFRGNGGSDTIDGGAGSDWVVYTSDPSAVYVNLDAGVAKDGWNGLSGQLALGGTDTIKNMENVEGSFYNDILIGSGAANLIMGRTGDDLIDGGAGTDTSTYQGSRSQYFVTSQADGSYTVRDTVTGRDGTDTLRNIENLSFTDTTVAITTAAISGDTTAPVIQSASVNGTTLTLTYNEALDPTHQPDLTAFLVNGSNYNVPITMIAESSNEIRLTLRKNILAGDIITVSYKDRNVTDDIYGVQDILGNDANSFTNFTVTNNTSMSQRSTPSFLAASFSEPTVGTSAITVTYNNVMALPTSGTAPNFSKNGSTAINVTGVSVSDHSIMFSTDTQLASTDYLTVSYGGGSYLMDVWGWTANAGNGVIGGSGNTTVSVNVPYLNGNDGNDSLTSSYWGGEIFGGNGMDKISVNSYNQIFLNEVVAAKDTVLLADGKSNPYNYATVYGFDVSGTSSNDLLDLPSGLIASNVSNFDGIDINGLKSHSISNGIASFAGTDQGGAPVIINQLNLIDAISYLSANTSTIGATVGFPVDLNNDSFNDSLGIFQKKYSIGDRPLYPFNNETFILLDGLVGATLGKTSTQGVITIASSSGPVPIGRPIFEGDRARSFLNEQILNYDTSGNTYYQGHGSTLTALPYASSFFVNAERVTTFGKLIAASDYVVTVVNDKSHNFRTDLDGNTSSSSFDRNVNGGYSAAIDLAQLSGSISISVADTPFSSGTSDGNSLVICNGSGSSFRGNSGDGIFHGGAGYDNSFGFLGDDAIYTYGGNDYLVGGTGADYLDGGIGVDNFAFEQGDSPLTSFLDNGVAGLDTGDVYNFFYGVDVVAGSGFATSGDAINFYFEYQNAGSVKTATSSTNGLSGDQQFFTVRGSYLNGSFTVDATAGRDTLVIYDGDPTSNLAQTAIVITGVIPAQLTQNWSQISLTASVADTFAPTLPTTYIDGNTLSLIYNEDLDTSHLPSMNAFSINVGGANSAINSMVVSGSRVTLTLATPVDADDVVTVSYVDPATINDVNAIQDLAGNDFATNLGLAVRNITEAQSVQLAPPSSVTLKVDSSLDVIALFGGQANNHITGNQESDYLKFTSYDPATGNFCLEGINRFLQNPNFSSSSSGIYGQKFIAEHFFLSGYITAGGPSVLPINQTFKDTDLMNWINNASGHVFFSEMVEKIDGSTDGTAPNGQSFPFLTMTATLFDARIETFGNNDPILIFANNDSIIGNNGNNLLQGFGGNDTMDGGAGVDTANYSGAHTQYQLSGDQTNFSINDLRSGRPDGVDQLKNFEVLSFSDGVFQVANLLPAATTANLHGIDYFWKADANGKHALLSGVNVTAAVSGQPPEGANAPILFKNITWDASGHGTAEVWGHASSSYENFTANLHVTGASSVAFATTLDASKWTVLANTPVGSNNSIKVGGYTADTTAALAAGDTKLGTVSFESGAATQVGLVLDFGQAGQVNGGSYGQALAHGTSDASGHFDVTGLNTGSYALTGIRSVSDIGNAVTSFDALAALKIAVGINPNASVNGVQLALSPFQVMSADVVGTDGRVTSADALAILKMSVGMPTAPAMEWMFVEETRDLSGITRTSAAWDHNIGANVQGDTTVNLAGFIKGDVNGSWVPPSGTQYVETGDPTHFTNLSNIFHIPLSEWGVL